jgi:hypothetical protein
MCRQVALLAHIILILSQSVLFLLLYAMCFAENNKYQLYSLWFKPTITTITPPVWLIQDKIMYKGNVMVNKSLIEKSWLTNLHNHLLPESIHYTI